eukprot:209099-Pyramimonas_sp.AAC.1
MMRGIRARAPRTPGAQVFEIESPSNPPEEGGHFSCPGRGKQGHRKRKMRRWGGGRGDHAKRIRPRMPRHNRISRLTVDPGGLGRAEPEL